jgi:hypothetical protein
MSIIIQKDNPNDPSNPRIYRMNNNNDRTYTYTRLNPDFSEYKNANGESDIFTNNTDFTNAGYREIQEQRGGKKQKKSKKSRKGKTIRRRKSIRRRKTIKRRK